MKVTTILATLFIFILGIFILAQSKSNLSEEELVTKVLDNFHDAASNADGDRYFSLLSEDAIFLGTDATERWTVEEFKKYALPNFKRGRGWTYVAKSRHIYVSTDKKTAWFDESLDNDNYGECRGSGVLVKKNGIWKIVQYNLTIPIPNSLARKVAAMIRTETK